VSLALTPLPVLFLSPWFNQVCWRQVVLIKSSRALVAACLLAQLWPLVGDNRHKTAWSEARWQKRRRSDAPTIKHEIVICAAACISDDVE
jgi:hypothetical protein